MINVSALIPMHGIMAEHIAVACPLLLEASAITGVGPALTCMLTFGACGKMNLQYLSSGAHSAPTGAQPSPESPRPCSMITVPVKPAHFC